MRCSAYLWKCKFHQMLDGKKSLKTCCAEKEVICVLYIRHWFALLLWAIKELLTCLLHTRPIDMSSFGTFHIGSGIAFDYINS